MTDEPENGPRLPYGCVWISHNPSAPSYIIRLWDGRQQHFTAEWRAIKWAESESEA